jgi:uncharacterized protein
MAIDDLEPYAEYARPYYDEKDPAHDFRHIERIIRRLEPLSAGMSPPPRPHRLHFLACFHGLGIRIRNDDSFRLQVRDFLLGLGWGEGEVDRGFQSIGRHLEDPVTTEEKIVRDANFLELLGAYGVAKAFITGGARGQSVSESAEIYRARYLEKIEFRTPVARQLAAEGREFAKAFLERLDREV